MKKKTKIFLGIIALLAVIIIGVLAGNKISNFAESKKDGVPLNLSSYFSDCDSNEKLADEKYIGERYSVTGEIWDIKSTAFGYEVFVETEMTSRLNYEEVFIFELYNEDDIDNLQVGQYVVATGTFTETTAKCYRGGRLENAVIEIK